jgi:mono/diheme cytochrome c family protein
VLRSYTRTVGAIVAGLVIATYGFVASFAEEREGQGPRVFSATDFAAKVQPLLASRCFSCHGSDAQEGGLRLDIRRLALAGGDSATAIHPGSSERSALIARVVSDDPKNRMPFDDEPLSPDQIQLLRTWIDAGAPWPDELAGHEAAPNHWSFQPIVRPKPPIVEPSSCARTPIDHFVLLQLRQAGLEPSPEAVRRTLIRRLSLDLIGLPPSPEDVQAFVIDPSPDTYERLVDRLLASPHFGERWGKHWLDLARFAESDGYENDGHRPHAWRYRDWVIEAINRDMPFDRFTVSQLAGDLLDDATPQDRVATAFHRNTLHNSAGGADAEEFRTKAVKDRTGVTAAVWMGLTWNCAECHTHKYDPIAQREYYGLYAFFNNADHDQVEDVPIIKKADRVTNVQVRGNFLELAAVVEPGVPSFLPELKPRQEKADRLDLARWLVSPAHPLTARVAVNHIWQHLFGSGLVPTPENFGRRGESPSHPELLDWLAAEFAGLPGDDEPHAIPWSRKSLIRLIVCSSVYRQASVRPEHPPATDPDNRLLWRQNRFRIEAETIRDVALATSGLLNRDVGGPSIQPVLPTGLQQLSELKNERFQEASGSPYRRGLYVHMQRTFPYPMFGTFDGPDGNTCIMQRDRSTTPLQALTLLNDPALDESAKAMGQRLINISNDPLRRIDLGFELCLARPPEESERTIIAELIGQMRVAGLDEESIWRGVARTLLNLDETITRE